MGLLGSLDHFWIGRHGRTESIEDARFRLRRMLQVRALPATLIVVFGANLEYGWAQLVAIYLWVKAARVWYWPVRPERQPPPGYRFRGRSRTGSRGGDPQRGLPPELPLDLQQ